MPKRPPRLTESRLAILKLLGEYRCLSSRQIWQELQPQKHYTHTLGELAALRKLGMVQSRPTQPERGKVSEFGWFLLKRGAEAAGLNNYGSFYRRFPTREVLAQRGLELELARQVRDCNGWKLIKPIFYNSCRPLPAVTPQGNIISTALKKAEYEAIKQVTLADPNRPGLSQKMLDFKAGLYEQRVPWQANHYVAYRAPGGVESHEITLAVILILCPPQATRKYWQFRLNLYAKVARVEDGGIEGRLDVLAVFKNFEQAGLYRSGLQAAGFAVITVNEVSQILQELLVLAKLPQ
jgi:hypothetical protein